MKQKTLKLKKKVIASLSDDEKKRLVGGGTSEENNEAVWTTSWNECTFITCCDGPVKPFPW